MPGLTQSVKEDLYRLGNALSPRLDYVREETDVQTGHFALCPAFDMNIEDLPWLIAWRRSALRKDQETMMIDLNRWESRVILKALRALDEKWTSVMSSTDDEDIQSEYGNDVAQLQIIQERIEAAACKEFGAQVKEFSRVPAA